MSFLRRLLLLSLVAFSAAQLPACAGLEPIKGAGDEVLPPAGWVQWCDRHPSDPSCLEVYR